MFPKARHAPHSMISKEDEKKKKRNEELTTHTVGMFWLLWGGLEYKILILYLLNVLQTAFPFSYSPSSNLKTLLLYQIVLCLDRMGEMLGMYR